VRTIFRRYAELGSVRLLKEARRPRHQKQMLDERFRSLDWR
jgi:hypothetical protein